MSATWSCPPRRILVATDFGEAAARALAAGALVASAYDATLTVLHAERFEPPPYFTLDQIARLEGERRSAQAAAEAHLRRLAARITAYPIQPAVVDAPPVEAILQASAGADLVVLGTHGRHGPGRWWLGSVAERVVRASHTPVLVVKADLQPGRALLDQIAVVAPAHGAGQACAARLALTFGSTLLEAGARPAADLLSGCRMPILFVPDTEELGDIT